MRLSKLGNIRAVILSVESALIVYFLLGVFWNPPITYERFDESHRHYINRGWPKAWAGVSLTGKKVDWPLARLPFLQKTLIDDGSKWDKIVNLAEVMPTFTILVLGFYVFWVIWVKAFEGVRFGRVSFLGFLLGLGAILGWVYFVWFSRV